jgi:hypothetical protein
VRNMAIMKSSKKFFYLTLGIAFLLLLAAIAYAVLEGPRAEVIETIHDFGRVSEEQRLTHTFLIKNIGAKTLEITRVHPQCACTATHYDRLIRSGGQGSLTLTIKPFALRGQFSKKTEVFLNDPDHPKVVFILEGISRPLIEIQPSNVILFKGKQGEDLYRQVRLTSHLPEPWQISRYTTNIAQFIDVNLKTVEPGRIYVVEVRQKRQEPGKYTGKIELFTSYPKRPRLVLRVFGQVLPK